MRTKGSVLLKWPVLKKKQKTGEPNQRKLDAPIFWPNETKLIEIPLRKSYYVKIPDY